MTWTLLRSVTTHTCHHSVVDGTGKGESIWTRQTGIHWMVSLMGFTKGNGGVVEKVNVET